MRDVIGRRGQERGAAQAERVAVEAVRSHGRARTVLRAHQYGAIGVVEVDPGGAAGVRGRVLVWVHDGHAEREAWQDRRCACRARRVRARVGALCRPARVVRSARGGDGGLRLLPLCRCLRGWLHGRGRVIVGVDVARGAAVGVVHRTSADASSRSPCVKGDADCLKAFGDAVRYSRCRFPPVSGIARWLIYVGSGRAMSRVRPTHYGDGGA